GEQMRPGAGAGAGADEVALNLRLTRLEEHLTAARGVVERLERRADAERAARAAGARDVHDAAGAIEAAMDAAGGAGGMDVNAALAKVRAARPGLFRQTSVGSGAVDRVAGMMGVMGEARAGEATGAARDDLGADERLLARARSGDRRAVLEYLAARRRGGGGAGR
ncbi:MAG: hypothetical protein ACK5Z4_09075, partial [Planctomyces sp.]